MIYQTLSRNWSPPNTILLVEFQVQALCTMTAITVKEPRLQKTVKERNLQRKIDRGEDMIVAHNNRSSQKPSVVLNSSQSSAATSTRMRSNKNTNKKTNYGGNQNRKTTKVLTTEKELGDVMMKLEGKRPKCWSFVSERPSQHCHFMKLSNAYWRKILGARYSELQNLVEQMLSVT